MAEQDDRHPEDYCHRCNGPNISWFTPGAVWDPVMRPVPGEPWKWAEIICPLCFVELAAEQEGPTTWTLIPRRYDGQSWTSADEREAIIRRAKVEALREMSAKFRTEAREAWGGDVGWMTTGSKVAVLAASWCDERADRIEDENEETE